VSRDNVQICCPFCTERGETPDHRFRLGLTASGLGHCFNCGWKSRRGWGAVYRALGIRSSIVARNQGNPVTLEQEPLEDVGLPKGFIPLWKGKLPSQQPLNYLKKRGVTPQQIRRYQIGSCWKGELAGRVVVPIVWKAKVVGVVARDFTGQQRRRYLNTGKKAIWGPLKPKLKRIHVFEGVFKAMRAENVLRQPCVAILGSQLSGFQVYQIDHVQPDEVVLWPDPDRPGILGASQSVYKLQELGITVYLAKVTRPADECPLEEIAQAYRSRQPVGWIGALL